MPGRERYDRLTITGKVARHNDQSPIGLPCERRYALLNFIDTTRVDRSEFDAKQRRYGLNCPDLSHTDDRRISQDANSCRTWCDLLEQFWPLSAEAELE